jgi:hypothetical protein
MCIQYGSHSNLNRLRSRKPPRPLLTLIQNPYCLAHALSFRRWVWNAVLRWRLFGDLLVNPLCSKLRGCSLMALFDQPNIWLILDCD